MKISLLRKSMEENGIDAYIIPTGDYHGSEYIGEHFETRMYMSGFTGSAGTLVVTRDDACLWTDGRYFLQAEAQLEHTDISLMKMGEAGVPTIEEYLAENLVYGDVVGFDGATMSANDAWGYEEIEGLNICGDLDLVDAIWQDRPAIDFKPVWKLEDKYSGESCVCKLQAVRGEMLAEDAEILLLTSLDEIAWTLNLRGDDVHCNPVFMAFMAIEKDRAVLFANENSFSCDIVGYLQSCGIVLRGYYDIYDYVSGISADANVWIDLSTANYKIVQSLNEEVNILDRFTAALNLKAIKNPVEIENSIKAHLADGVAVTKFIYWLKHNVGELHMSEISLAEKLEEFRKEVNSYLGPSFDTIVGYGDHGAIIHYSATEETNYDIKPESFVLIDSGGQYLEGTTDITRTISLGNITDEQKKMYTAVLRGNLALANAVFLSGCSGVALDYLARSQLWKMGYDYKHGTGHGVGHLLNVHESPNAFRYRIMENPELNPELKPGMITSDEPGVYIEGQYGIRLENLILCVEKQETEYGRFLGFDILTLVPFDKESINISEMTAEEVDMLKKYHELVYEKISPYLSEEERKWLREECMIEN